MNPKLSKEAQAERAAQIDAAIALRGKTVYEYRGEPADFKSWRQRQEKKRMANRAKERTDRGVGAGSAGAKHVAKEGQQ